MHLVATVLWNGREAIFWNGERKQYCVTEGFTGSDITKLMIRIFLH